MPPKCYKAVPLPPSAQLGSLGVGEGMVCAHITVEKEPSFFLTVCEITILPILGFIASLVTSDQYLMFFL
jgi:hypothetical protein